MWIFGLVHRFGHFACHMPDVTSGCSTAYLASVPNGMTSHGLGVAETMNKAGFSIVGASRPSVAAKMLQVLQL
jgi:hypothetical protein